MATPGSTWVTAHKAVTEDEFFLDPTRITLVCGTAGLDGTSFKNLLAAIEKDPKRYLNVRISIF